MSKFGGATLTWLGHATLHLETPAGTSVLIDPWIHGNPKFPAGGDNWKKIDLILLTHGHSDHAADVVKMSQRYGAPVITMVELGYLLMADGVAGDKVMAMNLGGTQTFADLTISMVEARHSSSYQSSNGTTSYAGVAAGFVVAIENGPSIYLAGDTSLFYDMKLIGELYAPQIAVLPIGDYYTMGAAHGALAAEWAGAKQVVPIHWGTFPALTGTPAALEKALAGKAIEVVELPIGTPVR